MESDILEQVVCPKTGKALVSLSRELLTQVNDKIKEGNLKNEAGEIVKALLEQGLCTQENPSHVYPVREGIPIMIIEESISLSQLD